MSNTYKGYELAEAVDNGLFSLEQRANGAGYFNCTIGFILKDVGTNFLFKEFEIIEEQEEIDIQSIKNLEYVEDYEADKTDIRLNRDKINELVQAVKQLDKKIKEER